MTLWGEIGPILTAGKVLSGLSLVALLVAFLHLRRRADFPDVSYGGMTLSVGRLRALWIALLVGATGFGSSNDLLAIRSNTMDDPEAGAGASASTVTSSLTVPLPFYRYERQRTHVNGELAHEELVEGVLIPWQMLWAYIAFYFLVLRWKPDGRVARRLIEGKKKRGSKEPSEA